MSQPEKFRCRYCDAEQQPHNALELKAAKEARLFCESCGRSDFGNRTIFDVVHEMHLRLDKIEDDIKQFVAQLQSRVETTNNTREVKQND